MDKKISQFAVIYSFTIKPGEAEKFITAWRDLTSLIYKHEGSLGSRLHQISELTFLAYAQWPDKSTWKNAGKNLPESANTARNAMREVCEKIETSFELKVIEDLLTAKTYSASD
jgi:heme-degrading monooxygenase HmoA